VTIDPSLIGDFDSDSSSSDDESPNVTQKEKSVRETGDYSSEQDGRKNIFLEVIISIRSALFMPHF
jgi:hypothetical protein